jgi:predicted N-acetyltransferase YhbS
MIQRQGDIPAVFRVDFRSTRNQKFTDLMMTIRTREVESSTVTMGAKGN